MINQANKVQGIINNIENVIVGKRKTIELCLTAILAKGHILLEDVPGVGKTMLVRTIAKTIDADYKRIQFTPDLLPSDITGVSIYHPEARQFIFQPGPIMSSIILADEINRTTPKTQSALLEAMEERHVTVDGITHHLKEPFCVIATQNPIEYEGTFTLPEAQLDRFLLKLSLGYPTKEEEIAILDKFQFSSPIDELQAIISDSDVIKMQEEVKRVHIDQAIKSYIVQISIETRKHIQVNLGVSPRASLALMRACQSYAYIQGRDYVIPDDVKYLLPFVFEHRIHLKREYALEDNAVRQVLKEIIGKVEVPVFKGSL